MLFPTHTKQNPHTQNICKCNALPIHDDMFKQSLDNIREKIEERFPNLGKVS